VLDALTSSPSVKAAARKLCMSYGTFKKYAKMYVDMNTGKNLLEKFKNQSGKGMRKNMDKQRAHHAPERLFVYGQKATPERIAKLKEIIIENRHIKLMCNKCGYHERRLTDMKPPLLLNFINKTKSDWRLENLELVCYNCYFLYIGDPISNKLVNTIESQDLNNEIFKDKLQNFHQLDEVYLNHLRELGLDGEGDTVDIDLQSSEVVDLNDEDDLIDLI
jgi:hypothetical protein